MQDPEVTCLSYAASALWVLGYPDQALKRSQEALALAQELPQPFSLAFALTWAALLHQHRREWQATQERAEAAIALSAEQGFPNYLALGTLARGWALAEQGQIEEGIAQIRQGLVRGRVVGQSNCLVILAEAYRKTGQAEEGLSALAEALDLVQKTGERFYEAELYRLKGELTLQKFQVSGSKFQLQTNQKTKGKGPRKSSVISSQLSVPNS